MVLYEEVSGMPESSPTRGDLTAREGQMVWMPETTGSVFNQTMLRVRDPERSLDFSQNVFDLLEVFHERILK